MNNQKGIFLPLFAAVAAGVIFAFFMFSYDTVTTKLASQELYRVTDTACADAAGAANIQRTALTIFNKEIQKEAVEINGRRNPERTLRYAVINLAKFSAPVMTFDTNPYRSGVENEITGGNGAPIPITYEPLIQNVANLPVKPLPPLEDIRKSVFTSSTSAGATVYCEVFGSFKTWFLGEKKFKARAAYSLYVQGSAPIASFAGGLPPGGLTIAIAPYIPAVATDPRYRFQTNSRIDENNGGGFRKGNYSNEFIKNYSPLHKFAGRYGGSSLAYKGNRPDINSNNSWMYVAPDPLPVVATSSTFPDDDEILQPTDIQEEESLLTQCMNPPTLLRNIFVSSILELVGRHALLRNSTELFLINPVDRDNGSTETKASRINREVADILANPQAQKTDILNTQNQLPYINDKVESSRDINNEPFYLPSTGIPGDKKRALILGQLRNCFHLYRPTSNVDEYLKRFDFTSLDRNFVENEGFEDPSMYIKPTLGGVVNWDSYMRNFNDVPRTLSDLQWDQYSPWQESVGNGTRKGLTLAEVTSIMGSARVDPTSPVADLNEYEANIVSFLKYWLKASSNFSSSFTPISSLPAIRAPGIFPLGTNPSTMYASNTTSQGLNSSLILVLHRPISDAMANEIQGMMSFSNDEEGAVAASRVITVIYIPTRLEDDCLNFDINGVRYDACSKIENAFNIGKPNPSGGPTNTLRRFSPFNEKVYPPEPQGGGSTPSSTDPNQFYLRYWNGIDKTDPFPNEWKAYRRYWWDRLNGFQSDDSLSARIGASDNPVNWAKNVFYDRIVRVAPRL